MAASRTRDSLQVLGGAKRSAGDNRPKALSVTALTRMIKSSLERQFGSVLVEGEISNLSCPTSGHLYFTIKDPNAQISAVMFRGNQRNLKFIPKDGMVVRAFGEISVYERRGNYQILVRRMEEGGKGSLQAQFEALKEKLQKEGLFAPERKRPLPLLPQHVGVVTSASGAAIRDILNVISRRFPNLHVLLAPATVQGEGAAYEIAAAIDRLNEIGGLDVLIVGRGGGSLEDLWCFNEEIVARAIACSTVPVISAVGHEVDFTISDFVADLRAPTPSAAAELVVGCKDAFQERLTTLKHRLTRALREQTLAARNRLIQAAGSYVFREPANVAARHRQRLDAVAMRIQHKLRGAMQETQQTLDWLGVKIEQQARTVTQQKRRRIEDMQTRLHHRITLCHQAGKQDVHRYAMQLRALNPLAVLQRGYSVTRGQDGRIIVKAEDVEKGETVVTQVSDGRFESCVTGVGTDGEGVE
jgi:exodeoxyribonuclease VII large subunit